jgi:phosphoglycolate phosphatase
MPNKKMIIFDFDGTIADTFDETYNIYNEIAPRYRCKPITIKEREILRNKKPQDFLKNYGITKMKISLLLLKGRKKLAKRIKKIMPAEGMVETLKSIKAQGFTMGILTSNSKKNVNIFLKNQGLTDIFDFIRSGKHLFGKSRSLKSLLRRKKISKKSVVYIGDETRDIEAAKKVEIPVIAVSWGYNSPEILKTLKPEKLVNIPSKLLENIKKVICQKTDSK